MSANMAVAAWSLAVVLVAMGILWVASLVKRDVSIVDIFWGLGFILVGLVAADRGHGIAGRKLVVGTLVAVWGLRLALHLVRRNWGMGEDYRYQAMRRRYGARFPWLSLWLVFGLQAVLMWVVSWPIQAAMSAPLPVRLGALDFAGALVVILGIACEAVADWQLMRFKADPRHEGQVMDRGLWAYSRHPNYFGDALAWWGFFLIALGTPNGGWTIVAPLVMTYLLLRLSGVPLLERRLTKTRPAYAEYVRRTSTFVPWPPRR